MTTNNAPDLDRASQVKRELGAIIHKVRQASGFNEEEFAALVESSQKSVSRWESGYGIPRPRFMEILIGMSKDDGERMRALYQEHCQIMGFGTDSMAAKLARGETTEIAPSKEEVEATTNPEAESNVIPMAERPPKGGGRGKARKPREPAKTAPEPPEPTPPPEPEVRYVEVLPDGMSPELFYSLEQRVVVFCPNPPVRDDKAYPTLVMKDQTGEVYWEFAGYPCLYCPASGKPLPKITNMAQVRMYGNLPVTEEWHRVVVKPEGE